MSLCTVPYAPIYAESKSSLIWTSPNILKILEVYRGGVKKSEHTYQQNIADVIQIQVLEPIEQKKLSDKVEVISKISPQNEQVAEFYTTRIFSL